MELKIEWKNGRHGHGFTQIFANFNFHLKVEN